MPPFKSRDLQFTRREVEETRRIANLRIHVERAMERVNNFRIIQGVMPITLFIVQTRTELKKNLRHDEFYKLINYHQCYTFVNYLLFIKRHK